VQSSGDRSVDTADGRAATKSLNDAYARLKIARNSFHGNVVAAPLQVCACAGACAVFGSECCVHFETSVLGTCACGDVYATQCFLTSTYTSANTLAALCAHVLVYAQFFH